MGANGATVIILGCLACAHNGFDAPCGEHRNAKLPHLTSFKFNGLRVAIESAEALTDNDWRNIELCARAAQKGGA